MTKLESGQVLKREIRVHGVEAPVNVEITSDGLTFAVKGTKKKVKIGWVQVVKSAITPNDVKSYLHGKPFEFLVTQAIKRAKNQ
jgi:hypothetical protein